MHLARKGYKELCSSAVTVQTGIRGLAARNELHSRRQTRASIVIQVNFLCPTLLLSEERLSASSYPNQPPPTHKKRKRKEQPHRHKTFV